MTDGSLKADFAGCLQCQWRGPIKRLIEIDAAALERELAVIRGRAVVDLRSACRDAVDAAVEHGRSGTEMEARQRSHGANRGHEHHRGGGSDVEAMAAIDGRVKSDRVPGRTLQPGVADQRHGIGVVQRRRHRDGAAEIGGKRDQGQAGKRNRASDQARTQAATVCRTAEVTCDGMHGVLPGCARKRCHPCGNVRLLDGRPSKHGL